MAFLVVGIALMAVSFTLLATFANAQTGDTFTGAIDEWSAVYQKSPDAGEDAWARADGAGALDESSDLRLRIAFDIPADGLAGGDSLRYALPSSLQLGDGTQVAVFASDTVGDSDETSARVIGYAQVFGNVMTLIFNSDVATANATTQISAPTATGDSAGGDAATPEQLVTVPGVDIAGFVDLDFGFGQLTTDESGIAQLPLNDWLTLTVAKALPTSEPEAADEQAPEAAPDATGDVEPAAGSEPEPAEEDVTMPEASAANDVEESATPVETTPATAPVPTDVDAGEGSATDDASSAGDSTVAAQAASNASDGSATTNGSGVRHAALLRAAAANSTGIDFTDYLTNGTVVQKQVNGKWTAATEFNDGDDVQVTINYSLPNNLITTDSRTITYQVPTGIAPNEAKSGRALDENGKEIGDYTVGTDGKVTVTFDKAFVEQGDLISGNVTFRGKVYNTGDDAKATIHFGGGASDITVTKPVEEKNDIYTQKSGSLSADHKTASYTVTVGSNKGTSDAVTIEDKVDYSGSNSTGAKPVYQQNSLKIMKVDASGATTEVTGYTPTWGDNDGKGASFSVTGLPALGANEKYVATYTMDMNLVAGATKVDVSNAAGGTSGTHSNWAWGNVSWQQQQEVQKSGSFDPASGKISWRVTVNPNGRDVSGWALSDELPADCTLWGSYTVWGKNTGTLTTGGSNGDNEINYTFPPADKLTDAQKTDTYYVDFWTTAPAGNGQVSNTAKVTESDGSTYSGTTPVDVTHRDYGLAKSHTNESVNDDGTRTETWSVNETLPDTQLTGFTYADTIENAVDADNNDMGAASHYAYAADLESDFRDRLRLVVDNYTEYRYEGASSPTRYHRNDDASQSHDTRDVTFTVTYHDAAGNVVAPTDAATPVKSFTVTLGFADGQQIYAKNLVLDSYRTHVDTSTQAEGSTWTVKNTGSIPEKTSTASHDITKPKTFDKQVFAKKGQNGGSGTYQSDDATVSYDEKGVLSYRLLLNTSSDDNGTITITDTLPAGMTVVDNSVTATFFDSEYYSTKTNYAGTTFVDGQNPTYSAVKNDDGTTTLTITISGYSYSASHPRVAVTYDASVADDLVWGDPAAETASYTNTAVWNNHTDSQKTTVKRDVKTVAKTGTQLDKNGNPVVLNNDVPVVEPVNKVRYYVDINPADEDLNPQEDALTLTDAMQDTDKYDPQLDISSVKLYAYSITADHHLGGEISPDRYSVQYDQATAKLTVTVPDGLPCVLVYDYQIDKDAVINDAVVKNACSLDGSWSSASELKLKESSSSASAYHKRITLRKVDSENYQKPLDGSTFTLARWDATSQTWVTASDAVTPKDGAFTWELGGATPALTANALYRLVETTAPDGYALDQTPRYFIWMDAQNNKDVSYNASGASSAKKPDGSAGIGKEQITIFGNAGGTLYVPNAYTRLTAKKVWANEDGSTAAAPAGSSATVELRRYTREDDPEQTCTVHIHAEGNGSWNAGTLDLGTLHIQRLTPITLKIDMWSGMQMTASVDGKQYASFTLTGGSYTLTIDADKFSGASADVDIKVTNAGNLPNSMEVVNYTKPGVKDTDHKVVETATLDASNGWTRSWENLPKSDGAGNAYRYEVVETACSVAGTTTTYTNNNGIQTGTITVTNTLPHHEENPSYTLSETGGRGVTGLYAGAAAVVGASLAGIVALRRNGRADRSAR